MDFHALETTILENDLPRFKQDRLLKKLRKQYKQGKLRIEPKDPQWVWRLSAANLMNGKTDFEGFQFRSSWALELFYREWIYPKWNGENHRCLVLAEQGIGDEILFLRSVSWLLEKCPKAVFEVDDRLLPIVERSFPKANFISRWRRKRGEGNELTDYEKNEFDSYIPFGDLFHISNKNKKPSGEPYLKCDPDRVLDLDKIGLSWKGGRSNIDPDIFKGEFVNLQYGEDYKEEPNDRLISLDLDHNDMEQIFAVVFSLKEVWSVFSYICHVAGSQGQTIRAIKPPFEIHEDLGTGNNRLKWVYGRGKGSWKTHWYNSMTVYENEKCLL